MSESKAQTTKVIARAIGDLVVERGFASQEVVANIIERQRAQARAGVFRRLGELLVDEGILTASQVQELLALQGKAIRVCPLCFAQYNVDDQAQPDSLKCARCGRGLVASEALRGLHVEDDLAPGAGARALELASREKDSERLRSIGDLAARRFGPYEILGEISRGGMGIVYKARQPQLERVVALKVLLNSGKADDEALRRFRREARAVSRLRHPHIVGIHDVGTIDGINYFSMDFVEGLTLDQAVTADSLTERDLAEIFIKVCDAVHYAHGQGVVHRDLKPRNILIDRKRNPVLIDFGIARVEKGLESPESGEAGALTKSGEILGSPAFLAPEYITGEVLDYDATCDVWSLGACLYSALSGRAPHADQDTIRIIRSAATRDAPHIRTVARQIDRGLARVVMTAIERDRNHRYRNARELGEDLRRWLEGEDIEGRSSALARWWARVRPKVAIGAGLAASIVLVWMTGYYSQRLFQLEAERAAAPAEEFMREKLGATSLRLGEALLKAGDAANAERELSDALGLVHGQRRVDALKLRARARRALGKNDLAAQDEKDAGGR